LGHEVTIAARDPASESVAALRSLNPGIGVEQPAKAVADAEVVFVATPAMAAAGAVATVAESLRGKVIVDCTNPVGPGLTHALDSRTSASHGLQAAAPGARVVKAFTIYGFEVLRDNRFPAANVRPAMMFCGDDADAKAKVAGLIADLGWQPFDVGSLDQAVHLEHMTLLWIRLVRASGHAPHLAWAALTR
jgi:predicted dinucleotide-binding enzyme